MNIRQCAGSHGAGAGFREKSGFAEQAVLFDAGAVFHLDDAAVDKVEEVGWIAFFEHHVVCLYRHRLHVFPQIGNVVAVVADMANPPGGIVDLGEPKGIDDECRQAQDDDEVLARYPGCYAAGKRRCRDHQADGKHVPGETGQSQGCGGCQ